MGIKSERFKRVAGKRTNKVIERLRILSNCSNRAAYEYTERDVRKIFSAIEAEMKLTRDLLLPTTRAPFTLEDKHE